ncbi:hypothetical protein UFOVP319_13 [uncultured Caudovirales phage]|uniref:Uncharacterized protein n=1 Tax=uncultured Caudovirales phage TaxID=2100421 RepID=A0A6J5LTV1_9CAUD|nr:hypothetical protein UFOVP319_13 [uncultured Caudovirales phage]
MGNPYMGLSRPALETFKLEYETSRECLAELRKNLGAELNLVNQALDVARPERGLGISDHAVLRYMERVRGIDTEAIRAEIQQAVADGQQIAPDAVAGNKREAYILSGGQVVTVLPAGSSAQVMRRRAA